MPWCSLPELGDDDPLDPSPTLDLVLLCVKGKEPQTTVTHAFIQRMKPMMTYTDDARTASSNVGRHHGLRGVGTNGRRWVAGNWVGL